MSGKNLSLLFCTLYPLFKFFFIFVDRMYVVHVAGPCIFIEFS